MYLLNHTNQFYQKEDKERQSQIAYPQRIGGTHRDEFERDHGRIVHSSAFRRLQAKTQVIGTQEGDFHRTRLTHSVEVSQIARGIVNHLNQFSPKIEAIGMIDVSLLEAASLAHDLGHPPYGHQGERALNERMSQYGGFEGNAQTFRILTNLESKFQVQGLDLTRATLLSILKYPTTYKNAHNPSVTKNKPPKFSVYEQDIPTYDWVLEPYTPAEKSYITQLSTQGTDPTSGEAIHFKTQNKSLECSIMEIADDTAYATHDLEDAIKLKLIDVNCIFETLRGFANRIEKMPNILAKHITLNPNSLEFRAQVHDLIADIMSIVIAGVDLIEDTQYTSNRFRYKAVLDKHVSELVENLNGLVIEKVIQSQEVQTMEYRGYRVVTDLFKAISQEPKLLPNKERDAIKIATTDADQARIVCDYIAGMTDTYAAMFHSRLFNPRGGRLFDI
ncbi:MAG TPA: anti-phage deoxyguanosine triphosphatase [Bacilli bacterium]|nr:anti-phage deoxyguanosine triphosphatase [Bacilli bacterium]